ncbi:hypothetical protein E3T28_08150 [Cryobacterium sinapicolor]|uniref:Uncharacterized protein n=1 Tax=Cryobacterium sinapicolor TaxID=1259236 RepID=A0ABY2J6E5_9MICO|nr:hypothetical protein [Cryobacterium sinapicolor]TFD00490.1 hypothetical protein E3T28_08150 [Cryobacterium sinapicolor]
MSCTEVDALAGMLRAVGAAAAADTWVSAHADEDQEGQPPPSLIIQTPLDDDQGGAWTPQ